MAMMAAAAAAAALEDFHDGCVLFIELDGRLGSSSHSVTYCLLGFYVWCSRWIFLSAFVDCYCSVSDA